MAIMCIIHYNLHVCVYIYIVHLLSIVCMTPCRSLHYQATIHLRCHFVCALHIDLVDSTESLERMIAKPPVPCEVALGTHVI